MSEFFDVSSGCTCKSLRAQVFCHEVSKADRLLFIVNKINTRKYSRRMPSSPIIIITTCQRSCGNVMFQSWVFFLFTRSRAPMWPLPMMHWTSPLWDPSGPGSPLCTGNLLDMFKLVSYKTHPAWLRQCYLLLAFHVYPFLNWANQDNLQSIFQIRAYYIWDV